MNFLSEDCVLRHKGFLKEKKLKFSVLEKSYPSIKDCDLKGIFFSRLSREEKTEALRLKSNILFHELYFDSFSDRLYPCEAARSFFGSEANFLYEIECTALKNEESGFLVIFSDAKKRLGFEFFTDFTESLINAKALLAIDLWEHAYFCDFGFDKKRYLRCALSCLNLDKINVFYKTY